jgi:hypothetical protein
MKASGVKQSPDQLLARTGMNMAHKFPRAGQTNTRNIPAINLPGNSPETDAYAEKRRGDRAKQLKPAIKAALGTHGPKGKLPEEVELNEISKSEVDHHYDKWTTSEYAPNHHDAGDDNKIHKSALKYLRNTNEPKENHEKIAQHIANKFHGSGIDEAAPKKMDDVAKQNLEPAKKGVVGTVKSDFKNFKSFLAGKKETNEAVDSNNQTIDTLAGRSKKVPKEAKIDNAHSSAKVALKAEEVESLDEDNYLNKFLSSRGINPKFVSRNTKVAHAKSNEYKTWLKNHRDIDGYKMSEASEVPFDGPYTNTKKNVKDKSGAVHTPMSRAKDLAQQAMQRVKKDLK